MKRGHVVDKAALRELREILLARRDALCRLVMVEMQEVAANDDTHHLADIVDLRSAWDEDTAVALLELEEHELEQLDWALERLEEGSYGICDECEGEIDLERLQALPYVTTCIDCQHQLEAGSLG